ncbi:hypothetical protein [Campylobacter aviculae]|uniref:Uncharacterized protein n=1 Tax=Campylobacter aviculae TaxID=2510190 RepID=A0A4U7BTY4_9BACT|nr:hypothetical protein [Campylobacter aviculae]TKX32404.1 hypothetical protein CQA76_03520 [Campylobacter aviculae]
MKLYEKIKQILDVGTIAEAEKKLDLTNRTLSVWLSTPTKRNSKVETALLKLGIRDDERLMQRIEDLKSEYKKNVTFKEAHERAITQIKALLEEIEAA